MPSHEIETDTVTLEDVWNSVLSLHKKLDQVKELLESNVNTLNRKVDMTRDVLEADLAELEDQLNSIYREVR